MLVWYFHCVAISNVEYLYFEASVLLYFLGFAHHASIISVAVIAAFLIIALSTFIIYAL